MADPKVPVAPAKAAAPATPEKPKKEKVVYATTFPTAEAAIKEANERTKGPRRAFKCEHGGKTYFVVANNEGRAGGVAFEQLGGKVEELGVTKKPKLATAADVLSTVSNMPEDVRKQVLEQLAQLSGKK